jgi:hypothetical protein
MIMMRCLYSLIVMLAISRASSGGYLGVTAFAPTASRSAATTGSTARDMIARNPNFAKLAGGYLFPEIGRRRNQYVADHPELASKIISLGIGDTTLPIPPHILSGLTSGAAKLGTATGYSGYGDVQGRTDLRAKIAETLYAGTNIEADEVFVSGTLFLVVEMQLECADSIHSLRRTPCTHKQTFCSLYMQQCHVTASLFYRRCQVRHYALATNVWQRRGHGRARSIVPRLCRYQCHVGTDG